MERAQIYTLTQRKGQTKGLHHGAVYVSCLMKDIDDKSNGGHRGVGLVEDLTYKNETSQC